MAESLSPHDFPFAGQSRSVTSWLKRTGARKWLGRCGALRAPLAAVIPCRDVPVRRQDQSAGFSLIEVLIGLAITSVISALIFASLGTQMTQADAVRRATSESFDATMTTRLVTSVISSTQASWQDEDVPVFRGNREVVSGLFVNRLFGESEGLERYTIALRPLGQERRIEIVIGDETWIVARLPLTAEFRYLGLSGTWRQAWPPLPVSNPTEQDFQASILDYGLPVMMGIWDAETGRPLGLEARFENSGVLPSRSQDLFDPASGLNAAIGN